MVTGVASKSYIAITEGVPLSHKVEPSTMSLPAEIDELVLQLAASLTPSQYDAFVIAARTTLAGIPCIGPGSAYRVLAPLQRRFFDPPEERVAVGPRHHHQTKLTMLPPVGAEDPRTGGRDRTRLRMV